VTRRSARLLAAGLVALAVGTAAVAAVALLAKRRGGGAAGFSSARYLEIDLRGPLPELPPEDFTAVFESGPRRSLRAFVEALDRAAGDASVRGLVLRVGGSDAGWARLDELRAAVLRFRRSGKPAYAHLEAAVEASRPE
jgi:protease-4